MFCYETLKSHYFENHFSVTHNFTIFIFHSIKVVNFFHIFFTNAQLLSTSSLNILFIPKYCDSVHYFIQICICFYLKYLVMATFTSRIDHFVGFLSLDVSYIFVGYCC